MSRIRGKSAEIATQLILNLIENYELTTGDIVSDLELSRQLEMSRTPIREAIMSLIDNGILERTQTKVVVKAITLSDIIEILEVREAIEQKCAEIIIENGGLSNKQAQELLKIQDNLCANINSGDFDSNFDTDDAFHYKLIEYSKNSRFLDIHQRLCFQSKRLRWISKLTPSRYTETIAEHGAIIEFLLNKDLTNAKLAIHTHILNTQINYQDILNTPQWNKIAHEMKQMKS